jgi:hypothetical protein
VLRIASRWVVEQRRARLDHRRGRADQAAATAGSLMIGSSLKGDRLQVYISATLNGFAADDGRSKRGGFFGLNKPPPLGSAGAMNN